MSTSSACPQAGALRDFVQKRSTGEAADAVAQHLIECPTCRESAIAMTSREAVVAAIRDWSSRPRESAPPSVSPPAPPPSPALAVPVEAAEPMKAARPPSSSVASGGSRSDSSATQFDDHNILGPPLAPDELGRIGSYRVLELLGEGGMGLVYKAEDTDLGRMVALKIMRPSVAASEASRHRFLREARSMAAIEHDHIVSVYQVGDANGLPFLAMPFLQGETLDQRLRAVKKLPILDAIKYARQTAEGLEAAHARNLIHRDIKPGNLWLEKNRDRVKILDFGLAFDPGADVNLTQTGVIIGTPAYMSPEQASSNPVDVRSDLFSLGSVFYRMVTGNPPFQGQNSLAIIHALAVTSPTEPRTINPEVPAAVSKLIMRLLEKAPQNRPQSARELVAILQQIESALGGPANMTPRPDTPAASGPGPNASAALSAIQRALMDDVGLVEEASDVLPPPRVVPSASKPNVATGSSGVGRSPMAGSALNSAPGGSGPRNPVPSPGTASNPQTSSRRTRSAEPEHDPDELLKGIDTSYLDEVATAPPPMLPGMEARRRPRRPISWPLVISLLLLLFMAILVVLIILNRS